MKLILYFTKLTIYYSIIEGMSSSSDYTKKDISQITTYQSGIAQAAAHRVINRVVSDYLLQYGLTALHWFAVGIIHDAGSSGIRISDITKKLQTTTPFVTNTISLLESRGFVRKVAHTGDSRIKLVSIVPEYQSTIAEIEAGLREHMRTSLYGESGITRNELQDYIHVLYKIINR